MEKKIFFFRLEYLWNQEIERNSNRPSLFRVICKFIKTRIIVASIVFLFCLIFGFIGPTCFVRGLVAFAENPPRDGNELNLKLGLFLVFSILFVCVVFENLSYFYKYRLHHSSTFFRTRNKS